MSNVIAILEAQRDIYVRNAEVTKNPSLLHLAIEIDAAIEALQEVQL